MNHRDGAGFFLLAGFSAEGERAEGGGGVCSSYFGITTRMFPYIAWYWGSPFLAHLHKLNINRCIRLESHDFWCVVCVFPVIYLSDYEPVFTIGYIPNRELIRTRTPFVSFCFSSISISFLHVSRDSIVLGSAYQFNVRLLAFSPVADKRCGSPDDSRNKPESTTEVPYDSTRPRRNSASRRKSLFFFTGK